MTIQLQRGARRLPPRVLIYGPPKTGKTSWAAQAAQPLFLPTEDGLGTLDVPVLAGPTGKLATWDELRHAIIEAGAVEGVRTVVLDSITAAQDLCFAAVAQEERVPSIAHVAYGKGYPRALAKWLGMLADLDALRASGKLIIVIGHSQTEQYADPEGEAYDRHVPRLHQQAEGKPSLRAATVEWADIVAFASMRVMRKTAGEGFRERTLAVGNERMLYLAPSPARVAGSRLPMPAELPLEWAAFSGALRAAYAPRVQHEEPAAEPAATEEATS